MSDNFQLLKSDDDVLLFEQHGFKHTFIVGRFKELYLEQIRAKIYSKPDNRVFVIFSRLNGSCMIDQKVPIGLNSSKWESVSEERECQLLKLGNSGWQKGRLRVKNYVDFLPVDNGSSGYDHPHVQPKSEIKIEL
ncbi:MAG: KGK domain-containing protein [Trichodesmium sp. MO_231.B1]|nr:KGK domain-containing protein [Trichodesmium sp. MO_231.B1]